MKPPSYLYLCAVLSLLAGGLWAEEGDPIPKRKVTVSWGEIPGVKTYDVEISKKPEMDPLLLSDRVKDPKAVVELDPGTYYYRVRTIDNEDQPGPWSRVEGFAVNPLPPELLTPKHKKKFLTRLPEEGIRFEWKSGSPGSQYVIEIRDKKGVVLKRKLDSTEFDWQPNLPGIYYWRAGYSNAGGEEWTRARAFGISRKALPEDQLDLSVELYHERPRDRMLYAFFGFAPAFAFYSTFQDKINASNSTVLFANLEVLWESLKRKNHPWTLSANLRLDGLMQKASGTTENSIRGSSEVRLTRGSGKHRVGPTLGLWGGTVKLIQASSGPNDSVISQFIASTTRYGIGVGGIFQTQTSRRTGLEFSGQVRYDLGGTAESSKVNPQIGFGGGVSARLKLAQKTDLELGIHARQEKFKWTPLESSVSSGEFSTLFIMLLIRMGIRF